MNKPPFSPPSFSLLTTFAAGVCATSASTASIVEAAAQDTVYPKIKFTYTPKDIQNTCDQSILVAQRKIDQLIEKSKRNPAYVRTFKNTVQELERIENELDEKLGPILFLSETSPNPAVQTAANDCANRVSTFYVQITSNIELFQVLNQVALKNTHLDAEDAKLLSETLLHFKKSGANLAEPVRKQLATLREELAKIQNEFSQNLAKAGDQIALSSSDLDGLSQDFIKSLPKNKKDEFLITLLDASAYLPFMENAKNEEARRKVLTAHDQVAMEKNIPLLEKAILLRDRIAKFMGRESHAAYVLDEKMAQSPARVLAFLTDLKAKLKNKTQKDLKELLARKKKDDPSATQVHLWDWRYYVNQVRKEKYAVDGEKIREYFPVDHVVKTTFEIFQKILSISFHEISPAYAWAPDVRLFEVRDARKFLIGHFYLDLYPRENKYKHFAAFDLIHARKNNDGSYHTPVSAMVGNFPKPTPLKPALLEHDEVETFFHEFGHIMHQTLTTARYSSLAGTNVRGDFVEAPSQMLENWVWDKRILKKISAHYETGTSLPEEIIDQMLTAKHAFEGLFWSRQLFFAMADMTFHSSGENVKTSDIWNQLTQEIFLMSPPPKSAAAATFGHLMGGYDAGYYGYLWSKVFAEDMFSIFEQAGLEDSDIGARYRKWILAPGGTIEPDVLIETFLGRKTSKAAFYKTLGIVAD